MARCPQRAHASTCPPNAGVRQARMALKIFRCSQVNHFRLRSKKASGAARRISATSTGGCAIYLGSEESARRVLIVSECWISIQPHLSGATTASAVLVKPSPRAQIETQEVPDDRFIASV